MKAGRYERLGLTAVLTVGAVVLIGVLFVGLPRWTRTNNPVVPGAPDAPPAEPGRKIKAHLFYVAEDGRRLVSVEQDVPFGEGAVEQAKAIVTAQLASADDRVSAIPPGTTLRAVFITPQGEAYLDLSSEVATAHPGGTTNERLTTYALVNAVTVNLPAISSVQLLVNGKEVDTLAGHIDLRRPLMKNLTLVE
jgi:hypothetical protein